MQDAVPKPPTLRHYIVAQGTYFASGGLSSVLYPWMLAHELHADEALVGIGQMLATLPTMLLVLFGGAAADGRNLKQYVAQLQLSAALVPLLLGMAIAMHALSLPVVVIYAVMLATIAAFIMPARDALLYYVAPSELGLTRTVALATSATFGGQLVGILIAGSASVVGAVALLSLQAAMLAVAAIATARLRLARDQVTTTTGRPQLRVIWPQVIEGVATAWNNDRLRTIILLVILGGPVFNGVFLVAFALLNRDYYGNGSATLAGMPLAFMVGITLSSLTLARLKPITRQGAAIVLGQISSLLVLSAMHFALPYPVLLALVFWWGLTSGIGATISRSIVQAAAAPAHRARVMSLFQFGQVWGGPPGALIMGLCAQSFGVLNAMLVPAALTLTLLLGFGLLTPLWRFEREETLAS